MGHRTFVRTIFRGFTSQIITNRLLKEKFKLLWVFPTRHSQIFTEKKIFTMTDVVTKALPCPYTSLLKITS